MSALLEFWRTATPAMRAHVRQVIRGEVTERIAAVKALAAANCVPAARVMADRVPDESPRVTRQCLAALDVLAPQLAREAALRLTKSDDWADVRIGQGYLYFGSPTGQGRKKADPHVFNAQITAQLAALRDANPETRKRAAEQLAQCHDSRVVAALANRLTDRSEGVVRAVLNTIAALAPEQAVDAGVRVLHRQKAVWQELGAAFLAQHSETGAQELLDILRESDAPVVQAAASAVATHRLDWALGVSTRWLNEPDSDERVQGARIAWLLGMYELDEDPEATSARRRKCQAVLLPALKDASGEVQAMALGGLAANDWPPWLEEARRGLASPEWWVRERAVKLVAHAGDVSDLPAVLDLLFDDDDDVRNAARDAADALATEPGVVLDRIRQMVTASNVRIRYHGLRYLESRGEPADIALAARGLRDSDSEVRCMALRALEHLTQDSGQWRGPTRRAVRDRDWTVRRQAITLVGERGRSEDLEIIVERFNDPDEDVRAAALNAVARIAPERAESFARTLVVDRKRQVVAAAVEVLKIHCGTDEIVQVAIESLPRARGEAGPALLQLVESEAPQRVDEALQAALHSRSDHAKLQAAEWLDRTDTEGAIRVLRQLLRGRDGDVRQEALERLLKLVPDEAEDLALSALRDRSWSVRQEAVKVLGRSDNPEILERLLPLTRDEDEDVRAAALQGVRKLSDRRVVAEIVSSLNDVEENVREVAEEILAGEHGPVAALEHLDPAKWKTAVSHVRDKVDQINAWASRIGYELLGRPVIVHNYRQGLGRTWRGRGPAVVEIEVTDTPVTTGHPHGEQIMMGLALHEIGHHLCDIGIRGDSTHRGKASAEGVKEIYDYLRDERLERVLRSRRPEWGRLFDRLASYAFAQDVTAVPLGELAKLVKRSPAETRDAVARGELPGRVVPSAGAQETDKVALADGELLRVPGLVPPYPAFLACLRCGFDPAIHPDPKVAAAIALVPPNLKDLPHREVLQVAQRIGGVLGRTAEFKRQMAAFWQRLGSQGEIRGRMVRILGRLGEAGNLPGWLWREAKGIRRNRQVVYRPLGSRSAVGGPGWVINLGPDRDIARLVHEKTLTPDPFRQAQLLGSVRTQVRRLRAYFEQLGCRYVEEHAARRGRRIDLAVAPRAAVTRQPNMLIMAQEEVYSDAYIGILIDQSLSMKGTKIELAKRFAALVAESAKGLRGIEGHVNAFDDDTFYRLGDFERNAIAQLSAGGGNNDAGALVRAADLALRSAKANKLLIMISDGSPTECSVTTLRNCVTQLTRDHGIVCAQAAVDKIDHDCFRHFVDLSGLPMDEAVSRFGRMVVDLTRAWRPA